MDLSNLDLLWIVLCAGLVFMMQAGFLCLESGLTRSKNTINVALKNVSDFALAVALFWALGFALMFGPSHLGWIGTGGFFLPVGAGSDPWLSAYFLFQAMFCATAATIVSGAVAERMRFGGYLWVVVIVAAVIYPVFGHWAWGGVLGETDGWLADLGFVDFAGSTVVHSVGGWVALAAVLILGPRIGRFGTAQSRKHGFIGGNLPLAMLGGLLLFFGWFGFNGGSTFKFDGTVPGILVNTTMAAASGILVSLLLGWRMRGQAEVVYALNGTIAGLVAITASAHAVTTLESVLIGAVGGITMVLSQRWLTRRHIDDAVGAIPAHLAAGIWGTLAVALFGDLEALGTGLSRPEQLFVQGVGIVVCGLWAFGAAYALLKGIDRLYPLRIDEEAERIGLNVSEHGAPNELQDLLLSMEAQEKTRDLGVRVPAEPFTEVGQIAAGYNRVMGALEGAIDQTRAIIRDVRDGIVTITQTGHVKTFNPGAEQLFGLPAHQAIGHPIEALLGGCGVENAGRLRADWTAGNKLELRLQRDGEPQRLVEVSISESRLGEERILTGLVRDVTERHLMLEQLQHQRDLAEITLASIGDGVITTNEAGVVQYLNPVAEQLTGWTLDEARGSGIGSVYLLQDELSGDPLDTPVRAVLKRGTESRRHEHGMLVRRDGKKIPVQDTAAPIRDRSGHLIGAVLVFHDVSVTLSLTRELSHQASHDALTGVPNRREFERRLLELLTAPRDSDICHVLCYLDLDQFKVVNDTCGHIAGDELLRQVASLLKDRVRGSDVLARLGGDEFGIIYLHCPVEKAEEMAEALRTAIQEFRFSWEGKSFAIGVSIGLVPIEADETSLSTLLSAADTACYAAKESGRNRLHLYRKDDDQVLMQHGQMQWVTRLRTALDQDQLRLHIQPIVPLETSGAAIPHYEILVRLNDDGRLVSPGAFIPAAERYGLMPLIDEWVFNNTMAWLGDMFHRHRRIDGVFCINLSGASLSDARFREYVFERLAQAPAISGAICMEVTESSAVANLSTVVEFIQKVKKFGCSFALDDFGSGLSSFAYLKALPVDYLKIDGGFVKDIERDEIDLAMVQSINNIGHTMGLKTIAEFVETEGILQRLIELDVDYVQGYHIGKPTPLAEFQSVRMMPR
ncbi:MAG: ammonium transporter [Thioalkalivibrio sp.]|nr:MAG: ammonium transporter [Thioalkalivibrio sp.]